ncbi:restriction endonuclease subunit S [Phocaeicola vulgatus]|uniref:restriction endonuclease subunit S n=1 Tax=Phocaeicola vulgatus TaxID=821 RepID=UPI0039B3FF71
MIYLYLFGTCFHFIYVFMIIGKYLYYFCLSFDFSKLDKSTAMPSLTKTSIGNVLIPIPPYKEQERIVAKIDMVLDTMNEILRAV